MKEKATSTAKIKSEIALVWDNESIYYDESGGHGVKTGDEKKLWIDAFSSVAPAFLVSGCRKPLKPLRVLDVGCGTGEMGLIFSELGCDVTGIDLSRQMVKAGMEKSDKKMYEKQKLKRPKSGVNFSCMKFLTGDAEHLPFAAENFDIVITRHLLWTLPSPKTALSDWNRVLKQEGVLIVIDGVWDDGKVSTKIKKNLSSKIAGIIKPNHHGGKGYSPDIKEVLPYGGGVPEETARKYISGAGFCEISIISLENIRKIQRKHLLWYEKIMTGKSYYLISGKKT